MNKNTIQVKILKVAILSIAMSLLFIVPAFADASVDKVVSSIDAFREIMQKFAAPACGIAFVTAGLSLMGGQQGRQWAKPTMLFAAIGYAVCAFAPTIVDFLADSFK